MLGSRVLPSLLGRSREVRLLGVETWEARDACELCERFLVTLNWCSAYTLSSSTLQITTFKLMEMVPSELLLVMY